MRYRFAIYPGKVRGTPFQTVSKQELIQLGAPLIVSRQIFMMFSPLFSSSAAGTGLGSSGGSGPGATELECPG